jgi:quercetin dioxygenase-like cupin family protein
MSVGSLSQIERGRSTIGLDKLARLCTELGLAPDALIRNATVEDDVTSGTVARSGTHRRLDLERMGVSKEVLTPGMTDKLNLYRIVVAPGGSSGDEMFVTAPGEQIGYVLSGTLEIWVNQRMMRLNAGDSVRYSSESPRRWRNPGESETVLMWVVTKISG